MTLASLWSRLSVVLSHMIPGLVCGTHKIHRSGVCVTSEIGLKGTVVTSILVLSQVGHSPNMAGVGAAMCQELNSNRRRLGAGPQPVTSKGRSSGNSVIVTS